MYQPPQQILDAYANVLITFALRSCKGIQPGEVVLIQVPECAKPMLSSLRRAVLKAGGHAIIQYLPDDVSREFYELATDKQIAFFPDKYFKGMVDQVDHMCVIVAQTNKRELEGIEPQKIMGRQIAFRPYMEWRDAKENAGKFSWTLGLYGTPEMAKEVGMSLKSYWEQIIKACYLDAEDPVRKWQEVTAEVNRIKDRLNQLRIKKVRVQSASTDLIIGLGDDRRWLGGSGRNVPSFEIFISPDWRGTQGHIQFTEPLYVYGNLIERAYLEFKDGRVVTVRADKGEDVLKHMIGTENADKIGEFSLTDGRLSRITKFMGETLYDENVGGRYGNTHVAVGRAYKDSYPGDPSTITKEQWEKMGYNESVVHTDIVSTENRTVTATLPDGKEMVIYKNGRFTV